METPRLPYVKPYVTQLGYTADVRVSMTAPCKGVNSVGGSGGQSGCLDVDGLACQDAS